MLVKVPCLEFSLMVHWTTVVAQLVLNSSGINMKLRPVGLAVLEMTSWDSIPKGQ